MKRVLSAAKDLKNKGHDVKTYSPRNFRSTKGNLSVKDMNANRAWIRYWTKKRGAVVFDIGKDPSPGSVRSPFYEMERRSIYDNWEYGNIIQLEGY